MENTLENKAKFFAQYWGQKILKGIPYDAPSLGCRRVWAKNIDRGILVSYLELKPLSQITDEDAKEVIGATECHLRQNDEHSGYFGMSPSGIFVDSLNGYGDSYHIGNKQLDYLRSKGYVLPYNGLSVENQIEYGWVKLKKE